MAKRKKQRSEMPPDIDMEEWEQMVQNKKDAIRYDEEFLKICEFFECADAVADVIDDQFARRLTEQDRRIITNLLHWLSFVGYVIECPEDYLKGGDEEDFMENVFFDDGTTPKALVEAICRLTFFVVNTKLDLKQPPFWGAY